jgi:hypothetical protein
VPVEGIFIHDATLVEVSETALAKLGIEAMGEIATELVHSDLQHEARFLFLLCG